MTLTPNNTTTNDVALKACPFCGGRAAMGTMRYSESPYCDERCKDQLDYWAVACVKCCAATRGMAGYPSEAEATAAWSRRTPSPTSLDAETLMREFYVSKSYDPKAARPADNVKAAIAFTITAMHPKPHSIDGETE